MNTLTIVVPDITGKSASIINTKIEGKFPDGNKKVTKNIVYPIMLIKYA